MEWVLTLFFEASGSTKAAEPCVKILENAEPSCILLFFHLNTRCPLTCMNYT